jgi:hypothetical protein
MRRIAIHAVLLSTTILSIFGAYRIAGATPSTGVTSVILARGTLAPFHSQTRAKDFTVTSRSSGDLVMAQITIAVGETTGWHIHHGPVFAFVKAGP